MGKARTAAVACAPALVAALLFAPPAAAAGRSGAVGLFARAEARFDALRRSTALQRYRHNYEPVLRLYRRVFEGHPRTREAESALMRAGELHTLLFRWTGRSADLNTAQHFYRRLIEAYPRSPLADDAQFAIALLYYEHYRDPAEAYRRFQEVEEVSPRGDKVREARAWLRRLAQHKPPPPPPVAPPTAPLTCPTPEPPAAAAGAPAPAPTSRAPPAPVTAAAGGRARVRGIRQWSNPEYTRVVIDVDRQTNFYAALLGEKPEEGAPTRLYLDLFNSQIDPQLCRPIPVNDGILRTVRAGQNAPETARVVLDIDRLRNYRIFPMENPYRIVVDVTGGTASLPPPPGGLAEGAPAPTAAAPVAPTKGGAPSPPRPLPAGKLTLAQQLGLGVRRVVVDAGHGAQDPGAIGLNGLQEKEVTLDLALRLRDLLQREGLEVVLTRDRDVYLPLEERTAIANTSDGDLFVSLHCNSSQKGDLSGVETYYLNLASSRRAMETAARENSMAVARMSDLERILKEIFNSKMDESSRFADSVQRSLHGGLRRRYRNVKNLGVKQAPFYVLIGAEMPSILAEVSFINHRTEGRRLADPGYRQHLAESIAQGIARYARSVKLASGS